MQACREQQIPGFPHLTHWCSTAAVCALPGCASIQMTSLSPTRVTSNGCLCHCELQVLPGLMALRMAKERLMGVIYQSILLRQTTGVKNCIPQSNGSTKHPVHQCCKSCSFPALIGIHGFLLLVFSVSENKTHLLSEAQEKFKLHPDLDFTATLNSSISFTAVSVLNQNIEENHNPSFSN